MASSSNDWILIKAMQTILDTGHSWFLERMLYHASLEIFIIEGIKSAEPETVRIGDVNLGEGYSIQVTGQSRRFAIVLENVLAYQVTNESYTSGDNYEIRTPGKLCKYERSRYLDFVRSSTLIESFSTGNYTHFGLHLEDDIVDVVTQSEPKIKLLPTDNV
jgi:hypothetical protein